MEPDIWALPDSINAFRVKMAIDAALYRRADGLTIAARRRHDGTTWVTRHDISTSISAEVTSQAQLIHKLSEFLGLYDNG